MQEKISALIDDELDLTEQEEVLRSISEDKGLSATWQRYHLIGAALRHESMAHIPGFSERLSKVLLEDQGKVTQLPQRGSSLGRNKWVPGLALAASIAALATFGFFATQSSLDPQPSNRVNMAQIDQATRWENTTPDVEHTLNAFLVEHGEFTPMSSMNGLISYAKFVSYDASE